ncbi:MAG TPA: hypothetical protein DCY13_08010 [Verrucomicrobiales bacterium]|nr:hypothetical protein [Verrucomicrobiales bacterium]
MNPELILWIYIALLVAGGIVGFVKASSKASLIASSVFAGLLALINAGVIQIRHLADILLGVLIVVFTMRLAKTKKFMPAGMMIVFTAAALILRHLRF